MSEAPTTPFDGHAPSNRLSFGGGGWVLLLSALLCVALLAWALGGAWFGTAPVGDGRTPASYGFDLQPAQLDGALLAASGNPRDFLDALDAPRTVPVDAIAELNQAERGKYLVSGDRVIGVTVGGESRAYPLRLLNAHEVINDTLGGVPIAVIYAPLADAAVVLDRRLAGADPPRSVRFGVSGLLLDSTLLAYDRDEPGGPRSLWWPLEGRAVTGPAAVADSGGPARLRAIAGVQVVPWAEWHARRPNTTVAVADPQSKRRMKQLDYRRAWLADAPPFPLGRSSAGAAAAQGTTLMAPAVAVTVDDTTEVVVLDSLAPKAGTPGTAPIERTVAGRRLIFIPSADGLSWWVEGAEEHGAVVTHGRWFALWPLDSRGRNGEPAVRSPPP